MLTRTIGAGKSVFSRAFIRAAYEDQSTPVPSPTYLLQNVYDEYEGPPIHHFDLYRLTGPGGTDRLSMEESFQTAVSLIEWPDNLQGGLPAQRLDVFLTLTLQDCQPLGAADATRQQHVVVGSDDGDGAYTDNRWRKVCLQPHGEAWMSRLARLWPSILEAANQPPVLQ
ncbi:hypothetical protein WJX72_000319 [[Myrmecia] bisecta]|uniref:tRNA threonylcarbamoyladenosine biosynthesis protein TsaE n=1 Tax=[Myrmecia] bisecta TaxID=41462 RepID=A0AAW1QDY3_9CHLO